MMMYLFVSFPNHRTGADLDANNESTSTDLFQRCQTTPIARLDILVLQRCPKAQGCFGIERARRPGQTRDAVHCTFQAKRFLSMAGKAFG